MDIQALFALYGIPSLASTKLNEREEDSCAKAPIATTVTAVAAPKTFAEAVAGRARPGVAKEPIPVNCAPPKLEGGNVVVEIDEDEYQQGVLENQYSVIGRYFGQKRGEMLKTEELQIKLATIWKVSEFRLVPIGRKFFHIFLNSMEDQSYVMSLGAINLKPGVLRITRWRPDFNPATQHQVNAQTWIRIYNLPLEYWKPANLFNIARGAGVPLRIHPKTLAIENGIYARVMVDVDCSSPLPNRILVKRRSTDFFVDIEYEDLPSFCTNCVMIGHDLEDCRKKNGATYANKNKDYRIEGKNSEKVQTVPTETPTMKDRQDGEMAESLSPNREKPKRKICQSVEEDRRLVHITKVRNTFEVLQNMEEEEVNKELLTAKEPIKHPHIGAEVSAKEVDRLQKLMNVLEYANKPILGMTKTRTLEPIRMKPKPGRSLGYVTDSQRGYASCGDSEEDSEEEGFSYYMTRQASNAAKVKQKKGIKVGKTVRKPYGT